MNVIVVVDVGARRQHGVELLAGGALDVAQKALLFRHAAPAALDGDAAAVDAAFARKGAVHAEAQFAHPDLAFVAADDVEDFPEFRRGVDGVDHAPALDRHEAEQQQGGPHAIQGHEALLERHLLAARAQAGVHQHHHPHRAQEQQQQEDAGHDGGDEELDLIAGYKTTVGGTTFDMGGLYYYYPGSSTGGKKYYSDFLELYGSVAQTFGPATAKLTANYAPKQKALTLDKAKLDNLYVNVALSSPIPNTPFSLSAAVGHTFTKSFLAGGQRYTDWSLGASYTTGPVTFGLSYVDTSYAKNVLLGRDGRDIAKAGLVGSVGVAF